MYHFTVYDHAGNVLRDEPIAATHDGEAKKKAFQWLEENGHGDKPHRLFHVAGRLVSFKPHAFDPHSLKAAR